jgi:hypothetical protein
MGSHYFADPNYFEEQLMLVSGTSCSTHYILARRDNAQTEKTAESWAELQRFSLETTKPLKVTNLQMR